MRVRLVVLAALTASIVVGGALLFSGFFSKRPAPLHTNPIIASVMLERDKVCPKETDPRACEKEYEALKKTVTDCLSEGPESRDPNNLMVCTLFLIMHDVIMQER